MFLPMLDNIQNSMYPIIIIIITVKSWSIILFKNHITPANTNIDNNVAEFLLISFKAPLITNKAYTKPINTPVVIFVASCFTQIS